MILVIDKYDSFTRTLVHYLMELCAEVEAVGSGALFAAAQEPVGVAGEAGFGQ